MQKLKYINIFFTIIFICSVNVFTQTAPDNPEVKMSSDSTAVAAAAGKRIMVLEKHDGPVSGVAYSPDGRYLASCGEDGLINILNPLSGELLRTVDHKTAVTSLAFSPDSKLLACGDGEKIMLRDTEKFAEVNKLSGFIDPVRSLVFQPGENLVLFGCSEYLIPKWYIDQEKFKQKELFQAVHSLIFSYDGEYFVHGGEDDKLTVRSSESGRIELVIEGHRDDVNCIVYAPGDEYLVSGSDDESIRIWNPENGDMVKQLSHDDDVVCLSISSDGKFMASADSDGVIKLWDMTTALELKALVTDSEISALTFSPDNNYFTYANGKGELLIIGAASLLDFPGAEVMLQDFILNKREEAVQAAEVAVKLESLDFVTASPDSLSGEVENTDEDAPESATGQFFSDFVNAVSGKEETRILYSDSAMTEDLQKYPTYKQFKVSSGAEKQQATVFPVVGDNYITKFKRDSVYFTLSGSSTKYREGVELDSSLQYVVIYERLFEDDYKQTVVMKLADYAQQRLEYEDKKLWYNKVAAVSFKESTGGGSSGDIQINIPFKIKSKTFNRIFGGNQIGLRVKGDISFSLIGRKSTTTGHASSGDEEAGGFDFVMDQTQNISIRGKVGTKVDVDITQDTESLDFENTLKITYTGDSDEIVQKLEAGNIGLSLPGTKYVTFSGKNTGLFGIKTDLKVGNFTSTLIASLEKGNKKKLEIKGGVRTQEKVINARDYLKMKYFFLEDYYREHYSSPDSYKDRLKKKIPTAAPIPLKNVTLQLYVTSTSTGSDNEWADIYVDYTLPPEQVIDGVVNLYKAHNRVKLVNPDNYLVNEGLGYIYLKSFNLQNGEVLAARYIKNSGGQGTSIGALMPDGSLELQIVAEGGQKYDEPWSDNEWKNVYSLGGTDVRRDGFKMDIFHVDDSETKDPAKTYLEWYQVAQENGQDVQLDFLNSGNGEFTFPELTPFFPEDGLNDSFFGTGSIDLYNQDSATISQFVDSTIYKENDKTSPFKLKMEFSSKSTTYDLGFNVIENSEVVRLPNRDLVRDVDYIIDYNTGQLSIINDMALTGDVEILYESASIFQLDQKMLLGNRWEYRFNKDIWIGATAIYLAESSKEDKVHVGYEPKENFVWDVNGKASFEVPFFTRMVDNIPFISSDVDSRISLEGEIAQVIPNPNPLGKAYIDDFEGSKKQRSLGMTYYGWHPASFPDNYQPSDRYEYKEQLITDGIPSIIRPYFLKAHSNEEKTKRNFFWYNPKDDDQWTKERVYDESFKGDEGSQKVATFNVSFKPVTATPAIVGPVDAEDSWNGIMRYLPTIYQDFTEIKYIEFLARTDKDITLHFDIGEVSEDVTPNGHIDTEDWNQNNKLDDITGEDIGFDGMARSDGAADYDFYSVTSVFDSNRVALDYEFKSLDDHPMNGSRPRSDADIAYEDYNKTQGNGKLDTEDLDLGGNLDVSVKGYRYNIALNNIPSETNPYLVSKGYLNNFALYRIPLDDLNREMIGSGDPDMEKMKYVKMWFNKASDSTVVQFVSLDFVGNEWKATGDNDGLIDASTINNIDNQNYTPPFSVEKDDNGNEDKEQSVRLKVTLDQNPAVNDKVGIVTKELFRGENYLEYRNMKMYVHAGEGVGETPWPEERNIYFIYRFGKDSANYYEYRSFMKNGWNTMDLQLDSLTNLKTLRADSLAAGAITTVDSIFRQTYNNMEVRRDISIFGNPSLRDIRYLAAGVEDWDMEPLETELWLDDLRLTGIRKEKGMAMRARIGMVFADFATLDAEIEKKDAEFHTVNDRVGSGANQLNYNISSSLKLGKFFPQSYGITLPLDYSYIDNYSYTKYESSTDILVDKKNIPDSVKIKTKTHRAMISIKKNSKSKNPFIAHTLDKLSFNASATFSNKSNATFERDETKSYVYGAGYNLSFPSDLFTFSPFKWAESIWGLKKIKNETITLMPSSYSTSISTSQVLNESLSRKDAYRTNNTFTVTRNFSTGFNPFSALKTDYSLQLKSNMYKSRDSLFSEETQQRYLGIVDNYGKYDYNSFLELKFGELSNWNSSFNNSLSFKLTKWLDQSITHKTNYNWRSDLSERGSRTVSNSMNSSVNATLKTKEVLTTFGDGYDAVAALFKSDDKEKEEKKSGAEEKKGGEKGDKDLSLKDRFEKKNRKRKGGDTAKKKGDTFYAFLKKNLKDFKLTLRRSRNNRSGNIEESFNQADWRYMFAFTNEPGAYHDEADLTYSWDGSWEAGGRTGISISKNFSIDGIGYNYKRSYSYSEPVTFGGTDVVTQFVWPWGDGHQNTWDFDKNSYPLPDYSIRISGIEKMMQSKFITSITMNHSKGGSKSSQWSQLDGKAPQLNVLGVPDMSLTDDNIGITRKSYSLSFSPLIGMKITFKKGINLNAAYNYSFDLAEQYSPVDTMLSSGSKKYTRGFTLAGGYVQTGGFKTPFNFWPFNGTRISNTIRYNLSLAYNFSEDYKAKKDLIPGSKTEMEWTYPRLGKGTEVSNFSVAPSLTYEFSRKLNGSLSYSFTYTEKNDSGSTPIETTGHEIALKAVWKITGR